MGVLAKSRVRFRGQGAERSAREFQDAAFAAYYERERAARGLPAGESLDQAYRLVNGQLVPLVGQRPWVTVRVFDVEHEGGGVYAAVLNSKAERILDALDGADADLPAEQDLDGLPDVARARIIARPGSKPRRVRLDKAVQVREND